MRGGLAGVEHHQRTHGPGEADQCLHRVDGAEDIRGVREGHDPGAGSDDPGRRVEVQGPVVVHRNEFQARAGAFGQLLPGNQVGVVLHLGHHHLVAGRQGEPGGLRCGAGERGIQEGIAEQVQALGGVRGPDQFIVVGADEGRHGCTGILENLGGLHGEVVGAAVDRRVPLLVELLFGLQHADRVLRRGTGIQVDERPAVDGLLQDREVIADPQDLFVSKRPGRAEQMGWDGNHGKTPGLAFAATHTPARRPGRREIRHTDSP